MFLDVRTLEKTKSVGMEGRWALDFPSGEPFHTKLNLAKNVRLNGFTKLAYSIFVSLASNKVMQQGWSIQEHIKKLYKYPLRPPTK